MRDSGAALQDCLIIKIFAGTARVTACLKQFGMSSAFGTDHVRHKQSMAQADLTTKAGVELFMQWLSNPNVIGIFLAPPCGTASRARAIPMNQSALEIHRHPSRCVLMPSRTGYQACPFLIASRSPRPTDYTT